MAEKTKWHKLLKTLAGLRLLGSLDVTVTESHTDLDFRADQCAVGDSLVAVHDYEKPMNVSSYTPNGPVVKDLKTVLPAFAYDDPALGETVILMVHQAIYIPDLTHNLLSMMQVCLNDVIVNETPRFLADHITDQTHFFDYPDG